MLNYRTVLLSQTGTCSGILPMALRSTPHQSLALSIVTVRTYPNQKPWITGNICTELKGRAAAFKKLTRIPAMPWDEPSNMQSVNTGLSLNHTTPAPTLVLCGRACLPGDTSLPDELNHYYACFEASNTEACMRVPDDCVITLSIADVSKTFKQVNIHKAAGPDGLPRLSQKP
ncbi:unnamed protein product [Oncorhynchus mykiss]|uniref:Uncharacterized protein n=1 Tax=Oncorhynchus mykiss TaxID=8022 RepID=A0A060WGS2_ONCMY|nr:unnamed protein product [Oncorhynchus mykiss]